MTKGKKQHYVPRCYLKLFSSSEGFVNLFLLEDSQVRNSVPYSSQCQIDYYYGKDLNWENYLGKLESDCAPIFTKIADSCDYYPSASELSILRQFVIFQRSRTISINEFSDAQRLQAATVVAKMELDHKGIPYTEEILQMVIKKYFEDDSVVHSNLELARDVADKIDDLEFVLVDCIGDLITSDNPIIFANPFTHYNVGLSTLGLIVFFPIGKSTLALFYDRKLYPQLRNCRRITCSSSADISTLNAYQYIFGNQILIGSANETFEAFSPPNDEYMEGRAKIQTRDPISVFGDRDHKLVVTSSPAILLSHELSFCPLLSDAKKIPLNCRESIPRTRDDDFLEKIRMRSIFYPDMIKEMGQPLDLTKYKEFRKGIQRMEYLANKYWS